MTEPLSVSLSAYPKSGVTYLSFMLFYCFFPEECQVLDIGSKYVIDIHAHPDAVHDPSHLRRFYKSHHPYERSLASAKKADKVIYLVRDPIDVMMSAWDFKHLVAGTDRSLENEAFRPYVDRWLASGGDAFPEYGSWVAHVRSWLDQTAIPLHLVEYEKLVDQPEAELEDILKFLGADVPSSRRANALRQSSMKEMAALEERQIEQSRLTGSPRHPAIGSGHDRGYRFVNKGYRDSYHRVLTNDQRLQADQMFGRGVGQHVRKGR